MEKAYDFIIFKFQRDGDVYGRSRLAHPRLIRRQRSMLGPGFQESTVRARAFVTKQRNTKKYGINAKRCHYCYKHCISNSQRLLWCSMAKPRSNRFVFCHSCKILYKTLIVSHLFTLVFHIIARDIFHSFYKKQLQTIALLLIDIDEL